jgi:hypothetical protein
VDLSLRWRGVASARAFAGAVSVTLHAVTLMLLGPSGPIASCSVPQPVDPYE